jgi:hypothetical protein
MSREIKLSAYASADMEARTVGDLRELLKWCDEHHVADSVCIDWGAGRVYLELTGPGVVPAEWIECGDHIPPDAAYDILIDTHTHEEYRKPADFDWPSKDRLREAYRQAPDNYEEALEQKYDRYGDERRPE